MNVMDIQKGLTILKLYSGPTDGKLSRVVVDAIKEFQRHNPPLSVDGIVGKNTRVKLRQAIHANNDNAARYAYPLQKDIREFYGEIGENQVNLYLPYPMKLSWNHNSIINRIKCHEKVSLGMERIFNDTLTHYGKDGIEELGLDIFGGCLQIRKSYKGGFDSTHCWGISMDLNPPENEYEYNHRRARFARPEYDDFWNIVESHGATSIGRERDFDWMHFQFARLD